MSPIQSSIAELAEVMSGLGYKYFNIRDGHLGTDLKSGLMHYVDEWGTQKVSISASSAIFATVSGYPQAWAQFKFLADRDKGIKIEAMKIHYWQGDEGPPLFTLTSEIKSFDKIPSRSAAINLVEQELNRRKEQTQKRIQEPGERRLSTSVAPKRNRHKM